MSERWQDKGVGKGSGKGKGEKGRMGRAKKRKGMKGELGCAPPETKSWLRHWSTPVRPSVRLLVIRISYNNFIVRLGFIDSISLLSVAALVVPTDTAGTVCEIVRKLQRSSQLQSRHHCRQLLQLFIQAASAAALLCCT